MHTILWRAHVPGLLASSAAALVWLVLAWRSPTLTHHFAPMVAAGAWGYLGRRSVIQPTLADRLLMAGGALTLTMAVYLTLALTDRLRGPGLIEPIAASIELPLMAVAGAVIGGGLWCLFTEAGRGQPAP